MEPDNSKSNNPLAASGALGTKRARDEENSRGGQRPKHNNNRNNDNRNAGNRGRGGRGRGAWRGRRGGHGGGGGGGGRPAMGAGERIRAMLVKVGDNALGVDKSKATQLVQHATGLSSVLKSDMDSYADLIRNVLIECAGSFPGKSALYALCLELLTRNLEPEVGAEFVGTLVDKLEKSLTNGEMLRARLLIRVLGLSCVFGSVTLDTFYSLLDSLLERAESLADEYSNTDSQAVFARQIVLAIVSLSPWLASSSKAHQRVFGSGQEDEKDEAGGLSTRLNVFVQTYATESSEWLSHRELENAWKLHLLAVQARKQAIEDGEKDEVEEEKIDDLVFIDDDVTLVSILRQIAPARDTDSKNQEPIALRPLIDFEIESTNTDAKLARPFTSLLPAPAPTEPEQTEDSDEDPVKRDFVVSELSAGVLRCLVRETVSTHHPLEKETCAALLGLPRGLGSASERESADGAVDAIVFEQVVQAMIELHSEFPAAFYSGILVRMCVARPQTIPSTIENLIYQSFVKVEELGPSACDRIARWIASHLISFSLNWPWVNWNALAKKEATNARRLLCQQIIQLVLRMSFYKAVLDKLPPGLAEWFVATHSDNVTVSSRFFATIAPEEDASKGVADGGQAKDEGDDESKKDNTETASSTDEDNAMTIALGTELVALIRSSKVKEGDVTDLLEWLHQQDIVGDDKADDAARARAEIELVVHASLKLGSKSLTHQNKAFEIVLPVLQKLLGLETDGEPMKLALSRKDSMRAVIDSAASFLSCASASKRFEYVMIQLIRLKLLTHDVLVSWLFEREASQLCQWWPWALLKNLSLGTKVNVENAREEQDAVIEGKADEKDADGNDKKESVQKEPERKRRRRGEGDNDEEEEEAENDVKNSTDVKENDEEINEDEEKVSPARASLLAAAEAKVVNAKQAQVELARLIGEKASDATALVKPRADDFLKWASVYASAEE